MNVYLAEPTVNERLGVDNKGDVFKFWYDRRRQMPLLSCMAREVFAGPPTTAGVERIFSRVGRYRGKLQRMINESTLQMYTFVAMNFNLIATCKDIGLLYDSASD
eukprot:GHVU01089303.1.p2 GENE.GHVU01089303.1~~GHVU01089303.1.p2  ORF type:complete len:105 (+),score=7.68 GHVU01089303.1:314-628(+)